MPADSPATDYSTLDLGPRRRRGAHPLAGPSRPAQRVHRRDGRRTRRRVRPGRRRRRGPRGRGDRRGRAFCAGMDLSVGRQRFGLDESLQPTPRTCATGSRTRRSHRPAGHRRPGHAGDLRLPQAGDRRDQRPRGRHRRDDDLAMDVRLASRRPASASSSAGSGSSRRPRRRGSCRGSSASSRRWSGSTPPTSSPRRRPTRAVSSARCTRPTTCWRRRTRWPGSSPATARRWGRPWRGR